MEKRRYCLLQAISPFLNVFHTYISLVRQNAALCGNGLTKECTSLTFKDPVKDGTYRALCAKNKMLLSQHFLFPQCSLY